MTQQSLIKRRPEGCKYKENTYFNFDIGEVGTVWDGSNNCSWAES
jgi:hypothetical protein